MNYTRMVIGECISGEQVKHFSELYQFHNPAEHPGFVRSELLTEEGGNMIVMETVWATQADCLRYHSSRSYRQFVQASQHLLVGNFVVKIFSVQPAKVTA